MASQRNAKKRRTAPPTEKLTRKSPRTPDKLGQYRAKRDFEETPEPAGGDTGEAAGRFVVQEHSATRLHWDLRLERDGVAVSWAVPNGIPQVPGELRKAIHTEDHPLEYLSWEGEIPKGNYGAGTMKVWDSGTYECHEWTDAKATVTFHGKRVRGRYHLFQAGQDAKEWMIRRYDPPSDPDREPPPRHVFPVVPVAGELPSNDADWAFEIQWNGTRALAYCEPARMRLESTAGGDITEAHPELRRLPRQVGAHSAVLDGELVQSGKSRFFEIYDVVHLDGHSLVELPWGERRARLEELGLEGPAWRASRVHRGDAAALLAAAREQGLAGIVAKPVASRYEPGAGWLAIAAEEREPRATGDLVDYYRAVAPVVLPHLIGRPLSDGTIDSEDALLRLASGGSIELHAALALADDIHTPFALVFDLDPGEPAGMSQCAEVALLLHGMFEQLGLASFAKTTGSEGLHVYVPLNSSVTYEQTKPFARKVAELVAERRPELVTTKRSKRDRQGRVVVDWSRNDWNKSTVCVYSLRARESPTVSTPVTWDEVAGGELDFGPAEVIDRVAEHGDLFAPVLSVVQELPL